MPIDGMPAMILGMGKYKLPEFWVFSVPMYLIRILALCAGAVLSSQCNLRQKAAEKIPAAFIVDATLPRRIRHKADYF